MPLLVGVVSISRRIDYDLPSSPSETEFLAMAWDSGIPILSASAMVYVTILNINDNSPVFLEVGVCMLKEVGLISYFIFHKTYKSWN